MALALALAPSRAPCQSPSPSSRCSLWSTRPENVNASAVVAKPSANLSGIRTRVRTAAGAGTEPAGRSAWNRRSQPAPSP
ncbi:hypothetical protein AHiyo8_25380 [Arthrobacter sp. Hiyo8]|nr:hypothetical protein AHiyo8_25380 [Arthrobacter sp. Hiyo8]